MNGTLAHWFLLICLLWVTAGYAAKRRGSGFSAANAAGPSKKGVQTAVAGSGKPGRRGGRRQGFCSLPAPGIFSRFPRRRFFWGETSNRYQLPVYGLLVFLLLYFFCRPVVLLWGEGLRRGKEQSRGKEQRRGSREKAVPPLAGWPGRRDCCCFFP